jgi:beta-lactamase class D
MKNTFTFLLLFTITGFSQQIVDRSDWKTFYDSNNVTGCIVIYDLNKNNYLVYNKERCDERFLPASTYKILNSLIALENEVIKDENEIIPWDSVDRQNDKWNMDQNLRTAIKYSVVWVYQGFARKIGQERMQHYVDTVKYGNCNIGGGIDRFWLDGDLRISAFEQIEFLKRLYYEDLPFSKRNIKIVKDILINEQTANYILRGKTGWSARLEPETGWYVGYLEENRNVYFFANNIDIKEEKDLTARISIVKEIFKSMGLLN